MLVAFTLPGRHLADIVLHQARGDLRVTAAGPGTDPVEGRLAFIDNTVDPATGVVRLKAAFDTETTALWPGQMAEVRLRVTELADRITVPAQAVQTGQEGTYLFVVKADSTVSLRPVRVALTVQGEAVIDGQLAEGERVVVDGQLQLAEGVRVRERGQGGPDHQAARPQPKQAQP